MATERTLTRRSSWAERAQPLTRNPAGAAAVALGGLLLVSIGVRIWLSSKIATPWILIDEYVYSELAKSFATSGLFLVRGAPSGVNNVVYPALISPAWLAHPMGTTYALANVINVVLMTATAIPLYLWARKLVAPVFALVAVALTLLPAFIYTGMLMTENAFLPAFVLVAFAMSLALERPTLWRQLAAFAAILLAVAIRFQGLALLAALPDRAQGRVRAPRRAAPAAVVVPVARAPAILDLAGAARGRSAACCTSRSRRHEATRSEVVSGVFGDHRPRLLLRRRPALGAGPLRGVLVLGRDAAGLGALAPVRPRVRPRWNAHRGRAGVRRGHYCGRPAGGGRGRGLRLALLAAGRGPLHVLPRAAALHRARPVAGAGRSASARAGRRRWARSPRRSCLRCRSRAS